MATPTLPLITALRNTARTLENSPTYQWGHMGSCNCGHLAQEITTLTKEEIHRRAMMRHGDWNDQLNDYCPTSGLPIDEVISQMMALGLHAQDLMHLERLSDPYILQFFPPEERWLQHNRKDDVVKYLLMWARTLEEALLKNIKIPLITQEEALEFATFEV
jgi:hypothetical protein